MLSALLVGYKVSNQYKYTSRILIMLIFYLAFYKVLAYYVLPIFFDIFGDHQYLKEYKISWVNYSYLYAIEAVSWLFWLCGILFVGYYFKNRAGKDTLQGQLSYKKSKSKWLLTIMALSFLYYKSDFIILFFGIEELSIPLYLELFKSISRYGGVISAVTLIVFGFYKWGYFFVFIGIIVYLYSLISFGTRGVILYSLLYFLILLYFTYGTKAIKYILLLFFSMILVLFIFKGLPNYNKSSLDKVEFIIDDSKSVKTTVLDEIDYRFGASSRMSTKFIDMYERGEGAGINPILNSLLGFFPRSIYPEKPYPSTRNGSDYYSQGMYLIHSEARGFYTGSMVEFATGAHAYWEFGWLGVVLLSTISGAYIGLCAYYFQRLGVLSLVFMMIVFKPLGYMEPKIWVSDIVVQIYQIIIPLILLLIILKVLKKLLRISTVF
jgi:hypothetical protein